MLREDDSREQERLERRAEILEREIDNGDNAQIMEEAILQVIRDDFSWMSYVYRVLQIYNETTETDNKMIDKALESENE